MGNDFEYDGPRSTEYRMMLAEQEIKQDQARHRRAQRGPWWRRLDAHDVGGLIVAAVVFLPLGWVVLRAIFT